MKKIIIAAAVVGAFAGTAQAQTSVTLYGIADVALRMDRGGTNGSFNHLVAGDLAPTRWGIRGTEALGGGLNAYFNFEQAINSDTGFAGSALANGFQRLSIVGLNGRFGNVRGGVDYSPYFRAWSGVETFGAATLASGLGGKPAMFTGGSTRMQNGIFYDSPLMSGLSLRAAYAFNASGTESNVQATKNDGRAYSLAALYGNGPFQVNLGHYNVQNSATLDTKSNTLGGTYNFKVVKLHAVMTVVKSTGSLTNTSTASVGLTVPVGKFTIRGQISRYNDKTAANADAKGLGIGALYSLSPRTTWYANWARLDNSGAAAYNITSTNSLSTAGLGSNMSGLSTGIRHSF